MTSSSYNLGHIFYNIDNLPIIFDLHDPFNNSFLSVSRLELHLLLYMKTIFGNVNLFDWWKSIHIKRARLI